jgi:hypothetical protein
VTQSNLPHALTTCGLLVIVMGMVCPRAVVAGQLGGQPVAEDPAQAVQQAGDPSQQNTPNPQLKLSPLETLRRFEPAAETKLPSSIPAGRSWPARMWWDRMGALPCR